MTDAAPTVEAHIPQALAAAVEDRVQAAAGEQVAQRLADGDATLWGPPGAPEIADRLGWLTIAERMLDGLHEIERLVDGVRAEEIQDVVLLGMGGSSLAPEVLRRSFPTASGHPRLHVLDSTDPALITAVQEAVELPRTLFLVSSKSGGTIEPLSLYAHFRSLIDDGGHFVAITDPGSGLEELAVRDGFRATFHGDPDIGGRYSALSPFGIVPAALMGVDVRELLTGAPRAWDTGVAGGGSLPGAVWLGAALAALAAAGRDKLTFVISPTLPGLGLWLEQLVAESTGKQGRGILPVAEEPLASVADYGPDRVFAHLADPGAPEPATEELMAALAAAGHPVLRIPAHGPTDLGRVFLLAELAVAVAGWGLEINPFDQPNVQQAKDATNQVLDSYQSDGRLPDEPDAAPAELGEMLLGAAPPRYVALMGYLAPTPQLDAAVAELRATLIAATGATTTFGYGPRFLHSTGQYHKGGPPNGRFLQLLHEPVADVSIPGRPFDFATLEEAQAIGDLRTLRGLGLPAARIHLQGDDPAGALRALTASIKERT